MMIGGADTAGMMAVAPSAADHGAATADGCTLV